jgi:hypothetical protein
MECSGDGSCFEQLDHEHYKKNPCQHFCKLMKCKECPNQLPLWVYRTKNGICSECTAECALCGGRLVPVGQARKNGKPHPDWLGRRYHKQCYPRRH